MNQHFMEGISTMPGAVADQARGRVIIPFPAEGGKPPGRLMTFLLSSGFLLHDIDIRSTVIPDFSMFGERKGEMLKINYCSRGRCELKLYNGEYTYLSGGEVAIEIGKAMESYYYPAAEYEGIELIMMMSGNWRDEIRIAGGALTAPDVLARRCEDEERLQIASAGAFLPRIAREIHEYAAEDADRRLIFAKALEILFLLEKMPLNKAKVKRNYYTTSQVEIAKAVKRLITKDLTVRYTAKTLAKQFGISETSLKNYFRGVYGCGYAEYQTELRMKLAAKLLAESHDRVVKIANAVGYASQTKFGIAFKSFYGTAPLEYRRAAALQQISIREER
ncbi:MAG: helix-turn-helix domain-containing protein [Lachnospiraceae bacterium]